MILSLITKFGQFQTERDGRPRRAANMKKTARELGVPHLVCFAHVLHNSLLKAIEDEKLPDIVIKCRQLIRMIRASPKLSYSLKEIQESMKLPQIKLKLDVKARWNSLFNMLKRLLENKASLVNLALKNKCIEKLVPSNSEWQDIMDLHDVLVPFRNMTELLSSSHMPSISNIRPIINNILQNVLVNNPNDSTKVTEVKRLIYQDFFEGIKQYSHIDDLLNLAALLDPRFKSLTLKSEKAFETSLGAFQTYSIILDADEPEIFENSAPSRKL